MSNGSRSARPGQGRWLRALLLLCCAAAAIAVVAVLAVVLTAPRAPEPVASASGLVLQPAAITREVPPARFGPPVTAVHSASDAVETNRGWVVLDARDEQIVFLDREGRFRSRGGSRGPGPGELLRAAQLAILDSAVAVVDLTGSRLDLFSTEGAFLRRIPLGSPDCRSTPVRELLGGDGHVVLLRLCVRSTGRTSALLERIGPTGERSVLEERAFSGLRGGTLDPTRVPVLARAAGRLYLGVTPDPCVREVGAEPASARSLCHPDAHPVPLPDSLRRRLGELVPRLGALGASVVVPDRYPPFEGVLEVGGRLAFHVLLEGGGRAWEVVNGGGLERILLPSEVTVFAGARGLLLAREDVEGTAFAVVPLP
jgi:hypothetical protein